MIPTWWEALLLTLAAYRTTRLLGWDDFPPVAKARGWVLGERWVPEEPPPPAPFPYGDRMPTWPEMPGKQPSTPVPMLRAAYDRPLLAHLFHCPFCLGWWVTAAWWGAWAAWHPVLYAAVPLALAGTVGLVAKNLDP